MLTTTSRTVAFTVNKTRWRYRWSIEPVHSSHRQQPPTTTTTMINHSTISLKKQKATKKQRKYLSSSTTKSLLVLIVGTAIVSTVVSNVRVVTRLSTTDEENNSRNRSSSSSSDRMSSSQGRQRQRRRRLLVIATAPRSFKYVVALWSQLECFTTDIDHVVLSGPPWSDSILNAVMEKAKTSIPQFLEEQNKRQHKRQVTIDFTINKNFRYDVGLWCDGLEHIGLVPQWVKEEQQEQQKLDQQRQQGFLKYFLGVGGGSDNNSNNNDDDDKEENKFDEYGLINDSVFALRPFTDVLDTLSTKNVRMTSLSYSFFGPQMKFYGPEHYWLESVWRGFDQTGIDTFVEYSCRYAGDPLFCPLTRGWQKKKCIINNFERAMAYQFDDPRNQTRGLFLADVKDRKMLQDGLHKTWVMNSVYWRHLVDHQGFPVAKLNQKTQIQNFTTDDRLKACTKFLDWSFLQSLDFSKVQVK